MCNEILACVSASVGCAIFASICAVIISFFVGIILGKLLD